MVIELVKWVKSVWPKTPKVKDEIPTFDNRKPLTGKEIRELIDKANKSGITDSFDL